MKNASSIDQKGTKQEKWKADVNKLKGAQSIVVAGLTLCNGVDQPTGHFSYSVPFWSIHSEIFSLKILLYLVIYTVASPFHFTHIFVTLI